MRLSTLSLFFCFLCRIFGEWIEFQRIIDHTVEPLTLRGHWAFEMLERFRMVDPSGEDKTNIICFDARRHFNFFERRWRHRRIHVDTRARPLTNRWLWSCVREIVHFLDVFCRWSIGRLQAVKDELWSRMPRELFHNLGLLLRSILFYRLRVRCACSQESTVVTACGCRFVLLFFPSICVHLDYMENAKWENNNNRIDHLHGVFSLLCFAHHWFSAASDVQLTCDYHRPTLHAGMTVICGKLITFSYIIFFLDSGYVWILSLCFDCY